MRRFQLLAIDLTLVALATLAALALRENLAPDFDKLTSLLPYLVASLLVSIPAFGFLGLDRSLWRYSTMADYLRVVVAIIMVVLGATMLSFIMNRIEGVSRSIPLLQGILAISFLIGARVAVRLWREQENAEPEAPAPSTIDERRADHVLVVGLTSLTEFYLRSVEELGRGQLRVGAIVAHSDQNAGRLCHQTPVFSSQMPISDICQLLAVHGVVIERVVVTVPVEELPARLSRQLDEISEKASVPVEFLAEKLTQLFSPRDGAHRLGAPRPAEAANTGEAAVAFDADAVLATIERPYWRFKRAIDIGLSATAMVLLAPVYVTVALVVAAFIGTPILFWQVRPGFGGRWFKLFKFRSMGPAHDSLGQPVPEEQRINAAGRFLRKTRLDELPQLWNIFKGEMSFVGPRPLLPVDQPMAYAARLLVRPGLTGWAQVMGGRDVSASDKAALDVWYVQNASLRLDLEIMARTVPVILFGDRTCCDAIRRSWSDLRRHGVCRQPASPEVGLDQPASQRLTSDSPPIGDLDRRKVSHALPS